MNMSGFDEKQTAIRDKISSELNTLPPIFSEYISYLKDAQKTLTTMLSYLSTLTACLRTIRQDYYISNNEFYKEISAADITEEMLSKAMYNPTVPDPELIIRTSGESRLSNFLLWQSAYSEIIIIPELWPDFNDDIFNKVIDIYRNRDRRFLYQ